MSVASEDTASKDLERPATRSRGGTISLSLRYALRELRGGLRGFHVFIACIALGVMAIAGVGSVAASLGDGMAREGRNLLGGDVAFILFQREAKPEELTFLRSRGPVSVIATLRGMARAADGKLALVEVKAVDGSYPSTGELTLDPVLPLNDVLSERGGVFGGGGAQQIERRPALFRKAGDIVEEIGGGDALGQRPAAQIARRGDQRLAVGNDLVGTHEECGDHRIGGGAGDDLAIGRGEDVRLAPARRREADQQAGFLGAIDDAERQAAEGDRGVAADVGARRGQGGVHRAFRRVAGERTVRIRIQRSSTIDQWSM